MELNEEKKRYLEIIENINAEKTILDRRYVKELQSALIIEAALLKYEEKIKKLEAEIADLKSKAVEKEIDEIIS